MSTTKMSLRQEFEPVVALHCVEILTVFDAVISIANSSLSSIFVAVAVSSGS